jgi:hypothetical protein
MFILAHGTRNLRKLVSNMSNLAQLLRLVTAPLELTYNRKNQNFLL